MQEVKKTICNEEKEITGTKEWAVRNINIFNGCSNDCLYCYAKGNAIRFKRKTSEAWKDPELNEKNVNKTYKKIIGRIMFPSSHDITPGTLFYCKSTLYKLVGAGNDVLVVSKPFFECIKSICDDFTEYRDKILFRFTITSTNNDTLKFWEPFAPDYEERVKCLRYAFEHGFQTSLSCEPYLDDTIIELVDNTRQYITDSIWIGKANRLRSILSINKHTDELTREKATELLKLYESGYSEKLFEIFLYDGLIRWKDSLRKEFEPWVEKKPGLDQLQLHSMTQLY